MKHATKTASLPAENLATSAMLVSLSMGCWGNRKTDKKVSRELARDYGVGEKAVRANKWLLIEDEQGNRAKEYMDIVSEINRSRQDHYDLTLPWGDDGLRIQTAANYMPWTQQILVNRAKVEEKVEIFIDRFPALKRRSMELMSKMQAAGKIKTLYNEQDYPEPWTLRDKFRFETKVIPLPEARNFRVDFRTNLTAGQAERICEATRRQIQADVMEMVDSVSKDLFRRLSGVVERVVRLGEPKSQLREVLVTDLKDVVAIVGRLNFTGNSKVEEFRLRVEKELSFDTQMLKEVPEERKVVAARAEKLMKDMAAFMGED